MGAAVGGLMTIKTLPRLGGALVALMVISGGTTDGGAVAANTVAPADDASPAADDFIKLLWKRQIGTSKDDKVTGVATDADDNVIITGFTHGTLGSTSYGARDAFVAKYNANGDRLWVSQLGTRSWDDSQDVATDAHGNIAITGSSDGSFFGPGYGDGYVARYNPVGDLLWLRQMTTGDAWGSVDGPNQGGMTSSSPNTTRLASVFGRDSSAPPSTTGQKVSPSTQTTT
ncbi:MAG: hypothetical protein U1E42_07505 [Rhodospirillales bacterium]